MIDFNKFKGEVRSYYPNSWRIDYKNYHIEIDKNVDGKYFLDIYKNHHAVFAQRILQTWTEYEVKCLIQKYAKECLKELEELTLC